MQENNSSSSSSDDDLAGPLFCVPNDPRMNVYHFFLALSNHLHSDIVPEYTEEVHDLYCAVYEHDPATLFQLHGEPLLSSLIQWYEEKHVVANKGKRFEYCYRSVTPEDVQRGIEASSRFRKMMSDALCRKLWPEATYTRREDGVVENHFWKKYNHGKPGIPLLYYLNALDDGNKKRLMREVWPNSRSRT